MGWGWVGWGEIKASHADAPGKGESTSAGEVQSVQSIKKS